MTFRIFALIPGVNMHDIHEKFPPAETMQGQYMSGQTVDINGRAVIVTFTPMKYRHYKRSHWGWQMYSAQYAGETIVYHA